jgi:hypothetical protein
MPSSITRSDRPKPRSRGKSATLSNSPVDGQRNEYRARSSFNQQIVAVPRRGYRDALQRHEVSWPGKAASAAPPPTP